MKNSKLYPSSGQVAIRIPKWIIYLLKVPGLVILVTWASACHRSAEDHQKNDRGLPVIVEPVLIHQLGAEHLGNAVYRLGMNGPRIAASGSRILEWPIRESAPVTEVVPPGSGNYQNGACAMDVNGDSIDEMIVGRSASEKGTDLIWLEEIYGQTQWKEHLIARVEREKGAEGFHDIMPFDMMSTGNRVRGVVIVVNRKSLFLFRIPQDVSGPWDKHLIADLSMHGAAGAQSGLVIGDIAGNGRPDIVCGNFWIECPADPVTDPWLVHRYSHWDRRSTPVFPDVPAWVGETSFGGMNQLDLGDMDGDGMTDIVATDAEIPGARVGIFSREDNNPRKLWKATLMDSAVYCPHSLVVADINRDDRPDILVGEMTAGGWWFPRNPNPKLYLYLNEGSLNFRKHIIHEGWGVHMMRMAPQQPAGTLFLFAADEIQSWYEDMTTNIVGWTIRTEPGAER